MGLHEGVLFPTSTTGLNPEEHAIAADLGEQNNLAGEQPEIVAQLPRKMLEQGVGIESGARPV